MSATDMGKFLFVHFYLPAFTQEGKNSPKDSAAAGSKSRAGAVQFFYPQLLTMQRDEALLHIRPEIAVAASGTTADSPAYFMHHTLRPVLKLQNELILLVFRHYLQKSKGVFWQLPMNKQAEYIANCIRQDSKLRTMLIGLVVGQFTTAEILIYHQHEGELSRRIVELLIQRLTDQAEKLIQPAA